MRKLVIVRMKEEYLNDILKLKKEIISPEENLTDDESILNYLREKPYYHTNSLCSFENGVLTGYILAYQEKASYIVEVKKNSYGFKNYKTMITLMLSFLKLSSWKTVKIEVTRKEYNLFERLKKYYPILNLLIKCSEQDDDGPSRNLIITGIDGNDISKVIGKYMNFRKAYRMYLYSHTIESVKMQEVLELLADAYPLEEIRKNKHFIIYHINKRNTDYLNLLGDEFKIMNVYSARSFRYGNIAGYYKLIEKLLSQGYRERKTQLSLLSGLIKQYMKESSNDMEFDKTFFAYKTDKEFEIEWVKNQILDNTKYYENTISYYRSKINRSIVRYYRNKKCYKTSILYSKYGYNDRLFTIHKGYRIYDIIPYNNSVTFENYMKNKEFADKVKSMLSDCGIENDYYEYTFTKHYISLLKH